MKQKDIAVILVIVFVSAVVSFFASKLLFGGKTLHNQEVEKVAPITTQFAEPSKKYFNDNSLNPARPVPVDGNNNNNAPFGG